MRSAARVNVSTLAPNPAAELRADLETSGDLRRLMKNLLVGLMQGDIGPDIAAGCIKACEQINVSLYSEIKNATILLQLGRDVPELGDLPLFGKARKKVEGRS